MASLYARCRRREKSKGIDFVQIACQTENYEKFILVELSGNLLDSTDSIEHSISTYFKLATNFAKQVREAFPSTYPEFGSKTSKEQFYPQQIFPNRIIYHLIVTPRFWNKPRYSSPRVALDAMMQHAQKHKIENICLPRSSTGPDKLKWLKVKGIITVVFRNSPSKITVHTQPQQQNCTPSETQNEKGTNVEMQQVQEDYHSLSTVLFWSKTESNSIAQSVKRHLNSLEHFRLPQSPKCHPVPRFGEFEHRPKSFTTSRSNNIAIQKFLFNSQFHNSCPPRSYKSSRKASN